MSATEFRATIPAGTKSQVSGEALESEVSWTFETRRPALVDSRPRHDDKWIDPKAELFLHFNMEMDPRQARDSMVLEERSLDGWQIMGEVLHRRAARQARGGQGGLALGRVRRSSQHGQRPRGQARAPQARPLLPPAPARRPARRGGQAGLGRGARHHSSRPAYTFRVAEYPSKACLPAGFKMAFSNPVRYKDLLAHMSVEPSTAMPELSEEQGERTGSRDAEKRLVYHYLPDIAYRPDTLYAFKIDGGLKDVFGNALGVDVSFTLETDGYCPKLRMPTGFGMLESYLPPRHPVDAVNVQQEPLEKAFIPEAEFVPFYQGEKWDCEKFPSPRGSADQALGPDPAAQRPPAHLHRHGGAVPARSARRPGLRPGPGAGTAAGSRPSTTSPASGSRSRIRRTPSSSGPPSCAPARLTAAWPWTSGATTTRSSGKASPTRRASPRPRAGSVWESRIGSAGTGRGCGSSRATRPGRPSWPRTGTAG